MESRVALVTGGTRGLGRAVAERLLGDGWQVVVCARALPASEIAVSGRAAWAIAADLREREAPDAVIAQIVERHGRLDLLVNNAGGSPMVDLGASSPSLIDKIIGLNLLAPLQLCRAAHPVLRASGGSVVNIASISGRRPAPGTVAYGAAKAGLLSATESLAMEWGPDVRVNALVVGLVENPDQVEHYGGVEGVARISATLPMQRMARGGDIASAIAWLASTEAAYVTGATIEIHGGGELPAFLALAKGAVT